MASAWVPTAGTVVVALLGFVGVLLTQRTADRRADKRQDQQWERDKASRAETRSDKRRQELALAIADFASTVAVLRRADYKRGLQRLHHFSDAERQATREETYLHRAEAESKLYLVSLLSDQEKDRDLVEAARELIEMCDDLSDKSGSPEDLDSRNKSAKAATRSLIERAGPRILGDA